MEEAKSSFEKYAYSVVHTNCLDNFSHIHELGHNFGANHDEDNAISPVAHGYAYRTCDDENFDGEAG